MTDIDTQTIRTAIETAEDIVVVIGPDCRLRHWRGSLAALTGYSVETLSGRRLPELVPASEREEFNSTLHAVVDGSTIDIETRFETATGGSVPIRYTATQLDRPTDGALCCGVIRDASAEREREQMLRRQTERFELLTKNLDEVVWIRAGDDNQFAFVNEAYETIWDRPRAELYDESDRFFDSIHHKDHDRVRAAFESATDGGIDIEYRIVRPNGEVRWIHDTAKGVYNEVDGSNQLVGIARDITHRKRREDQLNALHEVTQSLIEAETRSAVAEIAVTAADRVLGFDKVGLHLYDEQTDTLEPIAYTPALRRTLGSPPPAFDRGEGLVWEAYETGIAVYYDDLATESERYREDTPFRKELHVPLGTYGVMVFATTSEDAFSHGERSLAEVLGANIRSTLRSIEREELIATQRDRLDELVGVISHDIRNPLNVARGRAELTAETGDISHIDPVITALERVEELTDSLLSMAGKSGAASEQTPVDLDACAGAAWGMIDAPAATIAIEDGLPTVTGNESQLQQLFENLFSNAVRHAGPNISIVVAPTDDGFFIADDGPGIDPDERDQIFELDYSTDTEGTGFGLLIVQQVIDSHGWSIAVEEADGGGAQFTVTVDPADLLDEPIAPLDG